MENSGLGNTMLLSKDLSSTTAQLLSFREKIVALSGLLSTGASFQKRIQVPNRRAIFLTVKKASTKGPFIFETFPTFHCRSTQKNLSFSGPSLVTSLALAMLKRSIRSQQNVLRGLFISSKGFQHQDYDGFAVVVD